MRIFRVYRIFLVGILFLFYSTLATHKLAQAALLPEEILVLVNTKSRDSIRLGKLYIKLRNIPSMHLVKVKLPMRDQITRKKYNESIADPLRRTIKELHDSGEKIRCIVTTYGIPLRIGLTKPMDASDEEIKIYKEMLKNKKEELSRLKEQAGKGKDSIDTSVKFRKDLQNEINSLKQKLSHLRGSDTVASVDSELSLLLSQPYPIAGRQLNPDFLFAEDRVKKNLQHVLMVSRLDAPTPKLAEGLIRTAIEVEKTGLFGKLYLDARGLKSDKNVYGVFDEDIRKTAKILQKSLLTIVLDNRPELFGPGDAPSAALYCGWYSLANYKDAFEWSRGAVAYHVASAECRSLHDHKKNYWVKRMIEKGVIATLGPVAEPYLDAFPPPSLFFPLLMSGKYTLVEVFAMTNPFLSWRMVLIGDPLYTPFKHKPALILINPPPPPN